MRDMTSGAMDAVLRHPLMSAFASFPTACFILALAADLAYWRSAHLQWHNFAEWLLFAGLVVGGLVLLVEIVGLLLPSGGRSRASGWLHAFGLLVVLVLGVVNSFVHARDGWTGVVPQGLALSVAMVLVLAITGWLGQASFLRRSARITPHG